MEHDAEAAGLASVGGLDSGTHHPVKKGAPCRNCGGRVEERYCTVCGQLGADFHRPVWDLIASSIADMFALDGRLWRTLPMLLLRPGRMTRDYIEGRRARFVPPFRLFLLTSVLFFLTVFTVLENQPWMKELRLSPGWQPDGEVVVFGDTGFRIGGSERLKALNAELEKTDLDAALRREIEAEIADLERNAAGAPLVVRPDGTIDREALRASVAESNPEMSGQNLANAQLAADRLANLFENQERFGARLKEWAPRFTLFFLPIFSLLLALSYAWHRKRYIYDHLITGLHFQTFVYVLATLLIVASSLYPPLAPWAAGGSFLIVFVYLLRMLRVTYDTGYIMSFFRTVFLLIAGLIVLNLLAAALVLLSFYLT